MTLTARVTDDQLGKFFRTTSAIADRLGTSLDFKDVMAALERIHDGKIEKVREPQRRYEINYDDCDRPV